VTLGLTEYVDFSISFMDNTADATDLQAHILGLHLGSVDIITEHISVGEGFGYTEKTDLYQVDAAVTVGSAQEVQLVGRIDGDQDRTAMNYSVGANWIFSDNVFLQAHVMIPDGDNVGSDTDTVVLTRMQVLF
jgi:hypothetical protein